ncbi:nucleotidyl transferase AbiEii/AbiGii toxin family protein [Longispora sp. K20-0274]|uniref:nucleotidyl transferase AbiEii/AbiGii toxin family protein n=1 Tax=Longispora sp. K20-0274 TaxID=3088255 RepID=UPI00399C1D35
MDVVAGLSMTGVPDRVPPLTPLEIPGLVRVSYQVYPIADHVADKVIACFETRTRDDGSVSVSTRYKDLVDLVVFSRSAGMTAMALRRALSSEAERRGMTLPLGFLVPSEAWVAGYEARAREVSDLGDLAMFPAALDRVRRLLDPVLAGTAQGEWDPSAAVWR